MLSVAEMVLWWRRRSSPQSINSYDCLCSDGSWMYQPVKAQHRRRTSIAIGIDKPTLKDFRQWESLSLGVREA